MTGIELLKNLTQRDFSGSERDQYAQTLMTIWSQIGDDIYPLLEKAREENKKLSIIEPPQEEILNDVITVSDITLV